MTLRQFCNVTYAFLSDGLDYDARLKLDRRLERKFDHEMTPQELKVEEARRMMEDKGAAGSDQQLLSLMGAKKPTGRPGG